MSDFYHKTLKAIEGEDDFTEISECVREGYGRMWNYAGIEDGFAVLMFVENQGSYRVLVSVSLVKEGDELDTEMFGTEWFEDRDKAEVGFAQASKRLVHGEYQPLE